MKIRALSIALLLVTSTLFGQIKLELPPSPEPSTLIRFRVTGVDNWDAIDDVMVMTARSSEVLFIDVMDSRTPGEWGFAGVQGVYSIRVKCKGASALTGRIVIGEPPKPIDPVKPVEPVKPVDPVTVPDKKKVARVTYIYEKDQNPVPRPVMSALQRINREHAGTVVASEFEEDATDGDGDTPDQYRNALGISRNVGVPVLVVEAVDGTILNTVKAPTTEKEVMEAIAL